MAPKRKSGQVQQQSRQKPRKKAHKDAEPKVDPKDLYEASDSDPDEDKYAYKFDKVDNYEYELPSDFEDEEIDEDMAFTAEDKAKYGSMFGEDGEQDQDAAPSKGAADLLDSDQFSDEDAGDEYEDEDEVEFEDDPVPEGWGQDDSDEPQADDAAGDELDGILGASDDADEDADAEADEDGIDEEQHRDMLAAALGKSVKKAATKRRAAVVSEAYPESEYNVNPTTAGAGQSAELTLSDMMGALGNDGGGKLGAARKLLEKMGAKAAPVAAPLPRTIKERQERKAGYESTAKEVTKWQPIVKANREAPTLRFTSGADQVPRTTTTAAIVDKHVPATEMEAEVAELLKQAGANSSKAIAEAEEALALKALDLEEAKARRDRLAKMRSLLFYQEVKARHMNKIKSKEYHRKVNKAAKRKAAAAGAEAEEAMDEDEARAAQEQAEFERAKERLTLKHKNTSKWARRALKRGVGVLDAGTKAAIAEQLQLGEQLKRKIEGRGSGSDEDDEGYSTEASGSEDDGAGDGGRSRAKAQALAVLQGVSEEVPASKKGLFALPFMARALERQRQQAQEEARQLLQELQQQEEGGEQQQEQQQGTSGRLRFGSGAVQQQAAPDDDFGGGFSGSDDEEDAEAKAERLGRKLAGEEQQQKQKQASQPRTLQSLDGISLDFDAALGSTDRHAASSIDRPDHAPGRPASNGVLAAARQQQQEQLFAAAANGHTSSKQQQAPAAEVRIAGQGSTEAAGSTQPAAFIKAASFQGARPGYAFKKGAQGVGYYLEASQKQAVAAAVPAAAVADPAKAAAEAKLAAQRQAAIIKLHGTANKKLSRNQRKKIARLVKQQQGGAAVPAADSSSDDEPDERPNGTTTTAAAAAAAAAAAGDDEDAAAGMQPVKGSAVSQKDLIARAFAGDDVEAEFAAEKSAAVEEELPAVDAPVQLPGWGAWSGQQKEPKWMRDARQKAEEQRAAVAAGRKDAKLSHVVLSEKWDKKAAKYLAAQLPFPYNNKEVYESSMRQPLGRQYVPDSSFRNLTRPAVLKSTGVMIEPLRFSAPVAKYNSSSEAKDRRVVTVAGGMQQRSKK